MRTPEETAREWTRRHPRQPLTARQVSGIEAAALVKIRLALVARNESVEGAKTIYKLDELDRYAKCRRARARRSRDGA